MLLQYFHLILQYLLPDYLNKYKCNLVGCGDEQTKGIVVSDENIEEAQLIDNITANLKLKVWYPEHIEKQTKEHPNFKQYEIDLILLRDEYSALEKSGALQSELDKKMKEIDKFIETNHVPFTIDEDVLVKDRKIEDYL